MQITVFVIQISLGFTPNLNNNMKEKMKWILIAEVNAKNGLLKSFECHLDVKSVFNKNSDRVIKDPRLPDYRYTFSARQRSLASV